MYNSDLPTRSELPTSKQLLRSTLIAAAVATLLLITTVLPAEYGIDPIGIGRYLGLTTMGEIKVVLAEENAKEVEKSAQISVAPVKSDQQATLSVPLINNVSADDAGMEITSELAAQLFPSPLASDQKVVTLTPGEATEIKLGMNKGAAVTYEWRVEGGTVNFDTHGDAPDLDYHSYGKGRQVTGDQGVLEAAFDGKHGWFWRNRSANSVTITLTTQGDYQSIQRMM
mgnify:CR=1 FL=1